MLNTDSECDVPVPGIFHLFSGIGTGIGNIWYRKKEPVSVSEILVPEKSLGTGIRKIWYRKNRGTGIKKESLIFVDKI